MGERGERKKFNYDLKKDIILLIIMELPLLLIGFGVLLSQIIVGLIIIIVALSLMGLKIFLDYQQFKKIENISQMEEELEKVKQRNTDIEKMLTPEMREVPRLRNMIEELRKQQFEVSQNVLNQKQKLDEIEKQIELKSKDLICMDDDILVQNFGLYRPKFAFQTAEQYKERIVEIRNEEKRCIKAGSAVTGNQNWTVNGSQAQGKKMVGDMQKLLLRAFNSECDSLIDKVKYNNFDN